MNWYFTIGKGEPKYCSLDTIEGSDCFGHWILECAVFLPRVKELKKQYPSMKILLNCKRNYKIKTLIDFDITEEDVEYSSQFSTSESHLKRYVVAESGCIIVPHFTFGDCFTKDNEMFVEKIEEFRSYFLTKHGRGTKSIPSVYMTRSNVENYNSPNKREFRNHDEILHACGRENVILCQIDKISRLSEQFRIVQSAKVIVLECGSAMVNAYVFASNSHILILNRYNMGLQCMTLIEELMTKHGNTFEFIEPIGDWRNFSIDVNEFTDKLHKSLPSSTIQTYVRQINDSEESIRTLIENVAHRLRNRTVYITGIGKSALVARKSVATWQSLGLSSYFLVSQDMLHGDIGVLRENDVILYISNSGNTEELIPICSHIQKHFKVTQILICNNSQPKLAQYIDNVYVIGREKLTEIDNSNFAPTVSSVVFMICLDMMGVHLAGNLSLEVMKLNHPGGNLGKK